MTPKDATSEYIFTLVATDSVTLEPTSFSFPSVICYPSPFPTVTYTYPLTYGFEYIYSASLSNLTQGNLFLSATSETTSDCLAGSSFKNTNNPKFYQFTITPISNAACVNYSLPYTQKIVLTDRPSTTITSTLPSPLQMSGNFTVNPSPLMYPANGSTTIQRSPYIPISLFVMFQIENRRNIYTSYSYSLTEENLVPVLGNNDNGFYTSSPLFNSQSYNLNIINGGQLSTMFSHSFTYQSGFQRFTLTQTNIGTLFNNMSYYDIEAEIGYSWDLPIGKGNILEFLSRYSVFYSAYLQSFSHTHYYTFDESLNITQTPSKSDTTAPVLRSITITPFGGYSMLVTIRVTDDLSGVHKIYLDIDLANIIGMANIVSGNHMDGIYQFFINLDIRMGQTSSITMVDNAFNHAIASAGNLLPAGDFQLFPHLNHQMDWIPSDFTHFEFEKRDCYVTNKSVDNHLYFNVTNANTGFKPKLFLLFKKDKINFDSHNLFEGAWDRSRDMYNIPFTIPKNIFEGPLNYELITSTYLQSQTFTAQVGFNATLEITSEYADLLGPLITNVSSFIDATSFGWDIEIEDFPNGLASGQLNVTSNYDPVPIVLDINTLPVTGDKYKGVYRVSLPIPKQGRSDQIFTFTAYLKDSAFNVAEVGYGGTKTLNVNPFFKVFNTPSENQLKLPVPMSGYTDKDPPYLTSLTATPEIDVGLMNRTVTVSFTVTDDESGVYAKNNPHVYISTLYGVFEGAEATPLYDNTPLLSSYSCNITLPYGFGHLDQLFISVYGMFDNNLNTNGYSSNDLKNMSFTHSITRKYSF
eukprot:gene19757-23668_t